MRISSSCFEIAPRQQEPLNSLAVSVAYTLSENYKRLASFPTSDDTEFDNARCTYTNNDYSEFMKTGGTAASRQAAAKKVQQFEARTLLKEAAARRTHHDEFNALQKITLLKSSQVFAKVPDSALSRLCACKESDVCVKMIKLPPGVVVYLEGEPCDGTYLIASGTVALSVNGKRIGKRSKGGIMGTLSLSLTKSRAPRPRRRQRSACWRSSTRRGTSAFATKTQT